MRNRPQSESGYTLMELMIAMLMTLIVSGAIYGLLAAGQTAFRREPEVAELTQSVRTAMSMIQRDVEAAGLGFSELTQVFTPGLDNDSAAADAQLSVIAPNPDGQYADGLEFLAADEECPGIQGCGATATTVDVAVELPACMKIPGRLMGMMSSVGPVPPAYVLGEPTITGPGPACLPSPPALPVATSTVGTQIVMTGPPAWNSGNLPPAGVLPTFGPVRVISYRVALSGDPSDLAPCLWRSETGGRVAPYAAVTDPPSAAWQMVARGVEDMQVQYMWGTPLNVGDAPPAVGALPLDTFMVRRVRVTLSVRSTALNMQGLMPPGANVGAVPDAVRVQLVAEMTPRAALLFLQQSGEWQ